MGLAINVVDTLTDCNRHACQLTCAFKFNISSVIKTNRIATIESLVAGTFPSNLAVGIVKLNVH